jgi:putative endonuclease
MPEKDAEWYLYMVRCRDGKLYTGIATDIERRIAEHQAGKGAKYLRGRTPLKLVFKKKIGSRSLALKVEQAIKKLPKCRMEKIIEAGMDLSRWLGQ